MSKKKLYKSEKKVIFGVCGGIANYLNFDPTIVRLILVICLIVTGLFPVGLFYIVAGIIMPDSPLDEMNDTDTSKMKSANIPDEEKNTSKQAKKDDDFDSYFDKK